MAIIGIDLGTTNSLACIYRDGRAELIPNELGEYKTSSAVSVLQDGTVLVGAAAKERLVSHPESTAASFKVWMGVNAKQKMSIFAEIECHFSAVSIAVYTALIHHFTCRLEACQALIYQLVSGLTGENGKYNYSIAVHVYPPFFDIPCSAKNYKIAPALTPCGRHREVHGRGGEEVPQGYLPGAHSSRLSHPCRCGHPARGIGAAVVLHCRPDSCPQQVCGICRREASEGPAL